ncbi:MAG TPA: endonuclease/exonuclease/phosphatase family protein [Gemmatimonadales bacterium]
MTPPTARHAPTTLAASLLILLATVTACRAGSGGATPSPSTSEAAPAAGAAPAPVALRVLVLNMHAGKDAAGLDNLERVAALVGETGADVVLLQEVDSLTRRSGGVDQASELARRTGLEARFGNALAFQGGGYGIATLARPAVTAGTLVRLPVDPPQERAGGSREPRGVLALTLATPAGALHVLNTHLDPSADDRWRRQEADSVLSVALDRGADGAPVLVGGDLNAVPESAVIRSLRERGLRDLWAECGTGDGHTFPAAAPVRRIDYLLAMGPVRCTSARVLEGGESDHRGVLFEVRVGGG